MGTISPRHITGLLLLLAGAPAWGQGLNLLFPEGVPGYGTAPGVTVLSRAQTARAVEPMHIGSYVVTPLLEQSVGFDDNVLTSAARRGSWLIGTRPSLLVASGWSRDAFGAYVSAADTRYLGQPGQSRTDATLSLGGSIDIGRDRLTLAASHIAQHESRTALDAIASDKPIAFRLEDVRASYAMGFGTWSLTPELEATRWAYDSTTIQGIPAPQSYRDRFVFRGGGTLRYEIAPLRNLVFVTRALSIQYTASSPGQPAPDATAYQFLAGFDYDDNSVWRYRLLMGLESRQFAAATYRPHQDLIAEGEVTWNPTGMTTLRATLLRGIEDAAQEGVASYTYTTGRLGVDHELRRDWLLSGAMEWRQASFPGSTGQQTGGTARAGVTWLFARTAQVAATFDHSTVRGATPVSGPAPSYVRDLAMLTLRLGL